MSKPHVRLMIPGPVEADDEVLAALARQTLPHYGKEWLVVYHEVTDRLKLLFGTRNDLFLIPGPGSAAIDAALGSLMRTGEKVLVPSNGFFGRRTMVMAQAYGLEVCPLEAPVEQPLDPEAIRKRLAAEPGVQAMAVVHLETSSGILNPLRDIAAAAHDYGVPVIVDAVSSLGGVPLPVDEWGIDVCVTVGNKCLGCPPAVAPVSVSQRAWDQAGRKGDRAHGWYLNLQTWKDYAADWASWHPYPTTLPTNNIVALLAGLKRIEASGLDAHYRAFAEAAGRVRSGLKRLGFELFADERHLSPLITAVRGLPGMDVEDLRRYLLSEWQIMVSGGLDELHGRIFRVGHFGKARTTEYVERFLAGTEAYVRHLGR